MPTSGQVDELSNGRRRQKCTFVFPETRTWKPAFSWTAHASAIAFCFNRASVFNDNYLGRLKKPILSSSEASIPRRFSQKHRLPGSSSEIPAEIPEK